MSAPPGYPGMMPGMMPPGGMPPGGMPPGGMMPGMPGMHPGMAPGMGPRMMPPGMGPGGPPASFKLMMIQKLQQINAKVRTKNPDMEDEEILKKVWEEFKEHEDKIYGEIEEFKKEINDPEERKKVEEAITKSSKGAIDSRNHLIKVGKKVKEWGLPEYDTELGPKPVKVFKFKEFADLIQEHKNEVKELMHEKFPKMPDMDNEQKCLELAALFAMIKIVIFVERHPEAPEEIWENAPAKVIPRRAPPKLDETLYLIWVFDLEEQAKQEEAAAAEKKDE